MNQTAPDTRPSPDVMRGVIPYINLRGKSGEAADFYVRAFSATDLGRMPSPDTPGWNMHLQLEINGGALMMTDHVQPDAEDRPGLRGAHLQLVVNDGQAWWDRAVATGCSVVMPYEKQFWGDFWGLLEDPFGIQWGILEPGPAAG